MGKTRDKRDTHVDHVVERAVLSDGAEHRLVVRSGVDRRKTVGASGKTSGDVRGKDVVNGLVIETLEEGERARRCNVR